MDLPELIEMKQSLMKSLEIIESEIEILRNGRKNRSRKVTHYSDNEFVYIDLQILALALLLSDPEISPDDLARKVGVNRTTLYRWEGVGKYLRTRAEMQQVMQQKQEK